MKRDIQIFFLTGVIHIPHVSIYEKGFKKILYIQIVIIVGGCKIIRNDL